jgi:hypothetical protein
VCVDPAPTESMAATKSALAESAVDPAPAESVADLAPAESATVDSAVEPLYSVADYAAAGVALTETS